MSSVGSGGDLRDARRKPFPHGSSAAGHALPAALRPLAHPLAYHQRFGIRSEAGDLVIVVHAVPPDALVFEHPAGGERCTIHEATYGLQPLMRISPRGQPAAWVRKLVFGPAREHYMVDLDPVVLNVRGCPRDHEYTIGHGRRAIAAVSRAWVRAPKPTGSRSPPARTTRWSWPSRCASRSCRAAPAQRSPTPRPALVALGGHLRARSAAQCLSGGRGWRGWCGCRATGSGWGRTTAPACAGNGEGPVRRVRVDAVWIGVTAVTNARFGAFVGRHRARDRRGALRVVARLRRAAAGGRAADARDARCAVVAPGGGRRLAPPGGPVVGPRRPRWTTRWCTSPGTTRRPTARGPAAGCPRGGVGVRCGGAGSSSAVTRGAMRWRPGGDPPLQRVAGAIPHPQLARGRLLRHLPRGRVPAERLWPAQRRGQRVGVVRRLVERHAAPARPARENPAGPPVGERKVVKGGSYLSHPSHDSAPASPPAAATRRNGRPATSDSASSAAPPAVTSEAHLRVDRPGRSEAGSRLIARPGRHRCATRRTRPEAPPCCAQRSPASPWRSRPGSCGRPGCGCPGRGSPSARCGSCRPGGRTATGRRRGRGSSASAWPATTARARGRPAASARRRLIHRGGTCGR